MPKWGAVGLGKELADVDPDTVENVYDEANLGIPPKGPYLGVVKRFEAGETGENSENPGTPKIVLLVEISEPAGTKKARYNGYGLWLHRSVTEKGAGRINQILLALLDNTKLPAPKRKAVLEAFHAGNVVVSKPDGRGQMTIEKIGTWAVPEGMLVGFNTKEEIYNEEKRLAITSVMPKSQAPKGTAAPADDEPDEEEDVAEDDDEVTAREEELAGMNLAALKSVAKGLNLTIKRGSTEDDLITLILNEEFPLEDESEEDEEPEEDEEEVDDEPEEDEEGDEFDEMDRNALKKYIKAEGLEIRVTTSKSDDDLRGEIRTASDVPEDEPEEDEDDEPEPEKPAPRGRTAAKPAPKGRPAARRRAGSGKDDPPF